MTVVWLMGSVAFALDCAPGDGDGLLLVSQAVEVGDTVRVRVDGHVAQPTHVAGSLSGPHVTLQASVIVQPRTLVRQRVGCDPVPGVPDSCRDPFRDVVQGGRDAVLSFGPLQQAGSYTLAVCGTDHAMGELHQRIQVGPGGFDRFPTLRGWPTPQRQAFRPSMGPRYRARYGHAGEGVDVIWAPFDDPATARQALRAIRISGAPLDTVDGIVVRGEAATLRAGWLTAGGFVFVESEAVDVHDLAGILRQLAAVWPVDP